MISFTFSADQVRLAPPVVRQWIENQVAETRRSLSSAYHQVLSMHSTASVTSKREALQVSAVIIDDDLAASLNDMICWWRNQQIRERAYEIWEQAGRPDGKAVEHWLQAEGEIRRKVQQRRLSHDQPPGIARQIRTTTIQTGSLLLRSER